MGGENSGVVGLEPTVPVLETGGLPLTDTPRFTAWPPYEGCAAEAEGYTS